MTCCGPRQTPVLNDDQRKILHEMEVLASIMDANFVTICGKSLGADSVIGLIPGIGDLITNGVSLWIIIRAWYAFDPWVFRKSCCTMLMNCAIDFCIGCIPLAGDLFDIYWKSNIKNINIVRKHYGMEPMVPVPSKAQLEKERKKKEKEEKKNKKGKKKATTNTSRSVPTGDAEEVIDAERDVVVEE